MTHSTCAAAMAPLSVCTYMLRDASRTTTRVRCACNKSLIETQGQYVYTKTSEPRRKGPHACAGALLMNS